MFVPKNIQVSKALTVVETLSLKQNWFPTREEFISTIALEEYAAGLKALGIPYNDILATISLMHVLLVFRNAGMPTFVIKSDLLQLLLETDLPNLSVALLRLPFEGICIEVPRETFAPPAEDTQQIFVSKCPNDKLRIVFCTKDRTNFITMDLQDKEEITIVQAVAITKEKAKAEVLPKEFGEDLKKGCIYEDYYDADVFVFTVNALLYISSQDADIVEDKSHVHKLHQQLQGLKGGHKRKKLEEQLHKEKQHKIYICGANIRASKEYIASLSKESRQLTVRFRVRGHWRNQACGPKLSEHKLIWIQPYWKGPTYAELLERNYIVKR